MFLTLFCPAFHAAGSVTRYEFEAPGRLSAAAGLYRLCWCGAGQVCSTFEDYATDAGHLAVMGLADSAWSRRVLTGVALALPVPIQ